MNAVSELVQKRQSAAHCCSDVAGRVERDSDLTFRRSMTMATNSMQNTGTPTIGAAEAVDFDALMQANLVRVFNEHDSDRRRAALRDLYAEDATLYDPDTVATGREAISAAVGALLASLPPDFVFLPVGHAVGHNGVGRLFWRAGPPSGPVAVTGTDIAHFEGGRIKLLYVFLDPVPG
jgi:hypothetical protein